MTYPFYIFFPHIELINLSTEHIKGSTESPPPYNFRRTEPAIRGVDVIFINKVKLNKPCEPKGEKPFKLRLDILILDYISEHS